MSTRKFLPKKAYSISDAVKYISLNHNITISEKDLLEYIQNGDIQASIYLDGRINKIDCINKKEISENKKISVRSEEIFLQFSKSECNAKIEHIRDFEVINIDLKNIYFDLTIILNDRFYIEDYFTNNDVIKLYSGGLGKFNNVLFMGYFPLSKEDFDKYNIDDLMAQGFIDEINHIRVSNLEHFYLHLPFEVNFTKIYLKDIRITHKDLLYFLDYITETDNKLEEIISLKNELKIKESIIAKMQSELAEEAIVKSSTKSENKKNEFIKALLHIHYGGDIAENPRPHIYDPNMSEKSRNGVIQKEFELHGLEKHLPSGKTLKNWVTGIELDTKN